ncbi:transporter [Leifsonia sp. NPDC077715]|uniref:transporter n=1 Tax=Leifsonia sp. NPDC077715 TaxID=3155539 RepID=UPI003435071F
MAATSPEPLELEQDATSTTTSRADASRTGTIRVRTGGMSARRSLLAGLWPAAAAVVAGCVVAGLLLSASLRTEFPLFSEASAERGRDCTAIRSARHALDETLQARLPMAAPDVESARAIRSAVTAFDARTQDIATPAVESALSPVRGALDRLSDSIQVYAAAPAQASTDSARAAVEDALTGVAESWQGAIARVCS